MKIMLGTLQNGIVTFKITVDEDYSAPPWSWGKDYDIPFSITLPEGTKLTKATLYASLSSLEDNPWIRLFLNNVVIFEEPLEGGLPVGEQELATANVLVVVKPTQAGTATNILKISVLKGYFNAAICRITCWLELEYTGETPGYDPPPFWAKWPSWWPYAAAGGLLVGASLYVRAKGSRRTHVSAEAKWRKKG